MPKPIVIMKKWDKIMFKDCGKCIAMKQSGYIIRRKYKKLLITTIKMKCVVIDSFLKIVVTVFLIDTF